MKILYHHRTASKDGQAVHIEELIGALRQQGHEVRVVAPTASSGADMGEDVGWVKILRGLFPRAAYELLELAYSVVAYRKLRAVARWFEPDVIYERHNLFLMSGLMLKRRLHLPLMLEVNSPLTDERSRFGGLSLPWLARWSERRVWCGADVVLPVTRVLADILEHGGVAAGQIVVIPNGINQAHFASAPTADEAKAMLGWSGALVLGFTGFVRDWHRVDRALHWMAGPDAPAHARLLVVGDGPARAKLQRLASELGLEDRVRFTGFISRDAVPAQAAAFDIALQPAVTAYASPLKLFEYLALGKAIMAPRLANIEEILIDDVNAVLFEDGDTNSFSSALTRLAGDAALRGRLARRALATITERGLTWQHNAERVVNLATTLLERQPAGMGSR